MRVIDVTTINDMDCHVCVMDDQVELFRGTYSDALDRYPQAFSDSPGESSAEAAQTPS